MHVNRASDLTPFFFFLCNSSLNVPENKGTMQAGFDQLCRVVRYLINFQRYFKQENILLMGFFEKFFQGFCEQCIFFE